MSTWRRIALRLFPDMRETIQDEETTIWWVFFDLLPIALEAHKANDKDRLKNIYALAEWCHQQRRQAPELWKAAYAAFYEHLIDDEAAFEAIPYWVPPEIFHDMRDEFERRIEILEGSGRWEKGKFQELLAKYNQVNGTEFN
jgi:hypothetical protein